MVNKNLKKRKRPASDKGKPKRVKKPKYTKDWRKRYIKLNKRKSRRSINVANENEVYTTTFKRTRTSKKKRNMLRKLFRTGYNPFTYRGTSGLQLTETTRFNKCKWIFRGALGLNQVKEVMRNQIGDQVIGNTLPVDNTYVKSGNNYCCFYTSVLKQEITNPTNYDMNLVLYDIVYKDDCPYANCARSYFETWNANSADSTAENSIGLLDSSTNVNSGDPISLIHKGLTNMSANASIDSSTASYVVGKTTAGAIDEIQTNPTDSHLFNIYCRIVKKKVYRLQPGASLIHKFVFKPKKLMSRGTFGLKYSRYFANYGSGIGSQDVDIGIKGLTHGTLMKVWGQVVNSGEDDARNEVGYVPGKLSVKEFWDIKCYFMDQRGEFIKYENSSWYPTTLNMNKVEVVNDVSLKTIKKTNLTPADNMDETE